MGCNYAVQALNSQAVKKRQYSVFSAAPVTPVVSAVDKIVVSIGGSHKDCVTGEGSVGGIYEKDGEVVRLVEWNCEGKFVAPGGENRSVPCLHRIPVGFTGDYGKVDKCVLQRVA